MKTRFNTYDLICSVTELQKFIGMRVSQVYDIDNKTYLIRLQKPEEKCVLLLESGNRIHATAFEWPKNNAPSGFSMKMRKHLKNKRLESMKQLGLDRVVDLQFGSGEAAYHVILELYDRGNIILTDRDLVILNVLRPRTDGEDGRFAVRETYPVAKAQAREPPPTEERLRELVSAAKPGDTLKKLLNPHLAYGPAIIDHVLLGAGFAANCRADSVAADGDIERLTNAMHEAERLVDLAIAEPSKGYIVQKRERRPLPGGGDEEFLTNVEFHPLALAQHSAAPVREFPSFDAAVDEFFSQLEGQRLDMRAIQQEREALKKLANVRTDHQQRLEALATAQASDRQRAEMITRNQAAVDAAILAVRSALANQMSWPDVRKLVSEAQARGDPVAAIIRGLKLESNHITLTLSDPFVDNDSSDEEQEQEKLKPMSIDIDLALTAYANARKYYDQKRFAAKKQQKTLDAHGKALKSAERKTKQALKDVQIIRNINKARKVYWFEKFFWFISSENYLVIGGRDQIQNEMVVKRHLRPGDVYVHADVQGASSVVVKNPFPGRDVPPSTLNEAGTMAVCYSVSWEAKVVAGAYWVQADQVSRTAPTGEFLPTGSFMVRGRKNYLPPCQLAMGFSFLFKLDESSLERHKDERRVRTADGANSPPETEPEPELAEVELEDSDHEDGSEHEDEKPAVEPITEEVEEGEESSGSDDDAASKSEEQSDDESDHKEQDSDKADQDNKQVEELTTEISKMPATMEFPDTEIGIDHSKGNRVVVRPALRSVSLSESAPVPAPVGRKARKPSETKGRSQQPKGTSGGGDEGKASAAASAAMKRGQKGRLKKLRGKYKDQDEEERSLRMDILQSAGQAKEPKRKGKKGKDARPTGKPEPRVPRPAPAAKPREEGDDESDAEDTAPAPDETDMLSSLTGQPDPLDELLFAVPLVAPYAALASYKFKVKLTPGTGKRGKATKTALNMFLKERSTLQREKDLMRTVKDETLARNFPGKVKVSAPQLQKLRK